VAIAALYGTPWQYRLLFAKLPDLSDVDITELKLMIWPCSSGMAWGRMPNARRNVARSPKGK
jgi:hypothetical protein